MGSLVLVGRCYLCGDLVDQGTERSLPHSDGCALLRCQSVLPFLRLCDFSKDRNRIRGCGPEPSTPPRSPASGYSVAVRTPLRSPIGGAAAPPVSAPPQSPPASWRSSRPAHRCAARIAADRCLFHAAPGCNAHS